MKTDIRCLTSKPGYHWFGYYDKLQFDPSGRFVLCMKTKFEGRSPTLDDSICIGMIDLQDQNRWIDLGTTRAWCWQQGCMLQWIPGSDDEIIYNDRTDDGFCSHILNVKTGERRTIGSPVYALSPDGRTAVSLDFTRVGRLRPGYGYAGNDPSKGKLTPEDHGVFHVDLVTGQSQLIISIDEIAQRPDIDKSICDREQWFNHLLISPDSKRFIFLHRCRDHNNKGIGTTRAFTAHLDGSDVRVLHDGGKFSHFIWRGPDHILAWAKRPESVAAFYLIDEKTGAEEAVGLESMTVDGHCTYLPGDEWIVNDNYPRSMEDRTQTLYLYHPATSRRIDLGHFDAPPEYTGEWRCDLHPRHSNDGRYLTIDSTHEGNGRQLYLIDISSIATDSSSA